MQATSTLHSLTAIKNLSYLGVFIGSLEYIGFEPRMLLLLVILMLIDVCTGMIRVSIVDGGKNIESRRLRKGLAAKLLLLLMILSIGIATKVIGYDAIHYVQGAVTVIALGELYSIIGNVHSARTGRPKVEFDAVAFILKKLRDILDKYVQ